jgi:hypothetical protein
MDCFAELVIGRAFARPLARNDGGGAYAVAATGLNLAKSHPRPGAASSNCRV